MSTTTTHVVTKQVTTSGGTSSQVITTGNRDWSSGVLACCSDCKTSKWNMIRFRIYQKIGKKYSELWRNNEHSYFHFGRRFFAYLHVLFDKNMDGNIQLSLCRPIIITDNAPILLLWKTKMYSICYRPIVSVR